MKKIIKDFKIGIHYIRNYKYLFYNYQIFIIIKNNYYYSSYILIKFLIL